MEHSALGNLPERLLNPNGKLPGARAASPLGKAQHPESNFGTSLINQVLKGGSTTPSKGMVENFISSVDGKQKAAEESRRAFLAGESDNLHQTMIASQEANVAFTLMVEMRNKVMEAYQELMRMQI
ncbi:MAG: flagellar hook-basal body complex protein FliE [Opitutales bacterium]|nr:flagellar hook-basal body complex protein FliE [Opitutales bacterium]